MTTNKIAIFAQTLNFGGSTRVLLTLAKGFVQHGYDVDLLFVSATGKMVAEVPQEVNLIDFQKKRTLSTVPDLIRYLRNNSPDAFYCHVSHTGLMTIIAKMFSLSNTKVFITVHNTESKASQELHWIKQWGMSMLMCILFPMASQIIAVSQGVAEDIQSYARISGNNVKVIYNPIVTKKLKVDMQKSSNHPWLIHKSKPVVITAARLIHQKDLQSLIVAFKQVLESLDAHLIIVGEGGLRETLIDLTKELAIESHVDFAGYTDNPYSYMKNADLYVLSSRFEGFGNVLVEALACGCPVVSTDCPSGPREILNDGEYGKLVPVNDPDALSTAIIESLSEDHDTPKLQERAEYFSEDRIVGEYLALLTLN